MLTSTQQLLGVLKSLFQGVPQKDVYMREKLLELLKESDLHFDFCVQHFVDDKKTPIEDAYIEWLESTLHPSPLPPSSSPNRTTTNSYSKLWKTRR